MSQAWPAGLELLRHGREGTREYEAPAPTPGGFPRHYEVSISSFDRAQGRPGGRLMVFHDITKRKRAEDDVRRSEARIRSILDTTADGMIGFDAEGVVQFFNPAAESIFGYSSREAVGQNLRMLTPEPYRSAVDEQIDEYARTGHASVIGERGEAVGRRKDGTTLPIELVVSQTTVGNQPIFIGIARDITERRLAEEAFRYLRQRLQDVQEAERRDIARELHDEIGQDLAGLKYLLDSTSKRSWDEAADTIARSSALVDALTAKVRDLSLSLRPSMLDDLGLLPTLLWLIRRYTDQFGVDLSFEHVGLSRRFSPDVETAAYRIVQEGLTDIARHAATREASLRVSSYDGTLEILIEDPGVGFETAVIASDAPGIGLTGMRERAELLWGHVTADSAPGEGTRLKVEIPVKVDQEVAS